MKALFYPSGIRFYKKDLMDFAGHYPARAMPSAGVYPLMKSFMCDLTSPCFEETLPSEVPGQVNAPFDKNDNSSK